MDVYFFGDLQLIFPHSNKIDNSSDNNTLKYFCGDTRDKSIVAFVYYNLLMNIYFKKIITFFRLSNSNLARKEKRRRKSILLAIVNFWRM